VWETVCLFSNRYGGHLIFGAKGDGTPVDVSPKAAHQVELDSQLLLLKMERCICVKI